MAVGCWQSDAAVGHREMGIKAMLRTHRNKDFGLLARLTVPATGRCMNSCICQHALGRGSLLACVLAVFLVCVASAGADVSLYPVANEAAPLSLVAAGDGNLWFTPESLAGVVGEVTPSGTVSLRPFTFPFGDAIFQGVRPDGKLLLSANDGDAGNLSVFDPATVTYEQLLQIPESENVFITGATTDQYGATWYDREDQIDRISLEGPSYPVPAGEIDVAPGLEGLAMSSDGKFWMMAGNGVVSMTREGVFTLYPTPDCLPSHVPIVAGGLIWFACALAVSPADGPAIESLEPASGRITTYPIPSLGGFGYPAALVLGPDGALWFSMLWQTETREGAKEEFANMARLALTGALCYVGLPDPEPQPLLGSVVEQVSDGPAHENALWFSMVGATSGTSRYSWIGRITTDTPCSSAPVTPPAPIAPNPPLPPPLTTTVRPIVLPKVESLQIRRIKQGFSLLGFGVSYGTYTELLVAMTVPEFDAGLFATELAVEETAGQIGADPPRQDYYRAARGWATAARRPRRHSSAWGRLAANQLREATLGRALLLSIERLHGAAAAGQCPAVQDQDREIAAIAPALRAAFVNDTKLRGALRRRLSEPYRPRVLSARQFAAVQRRVQRSGLPKPILAALRASGQSAAEISSFTQSFLKATPRQARFAGALSSAPLKGLINSLGGLSVAARRSAGACQTSPGA